MFTIRWGKGHRITWHDAGYLTGSSVALASMRLKAISAGELGRHPQRTTTWEEHRRYAASAMDLWLATFPATTYVLVGTDPMAVEPGVVY